MIVLSCIFDIDHFIGYVYDRKKKIHPKLPWVLHVAFRRRSWFHSFTGLLLLLPFVSAYVPFSLALLSLLSHLLIDSMDRMGIQILPPFTKRKIRGPLPTSYLWSSKHPRHYRKAHIPAIIMIIILFLMILYNV